MKPLVDYLKKYYFFDENSEPNKFTFEDDTVKAVKEWLLDMREYQYEYVNNLWRVGRINMLDELISYLIPAQAQVEIILRKDTKEEKQP